jgi:hypothetical protein
MMKKIQNFSCFSKDRDLVSKLRILPSLMIVLGILKWISELNTIEHTTTDSRMVTSVFLHG